MHLEEVMSPHGNWGKLAVRDGTSDLSIALSTVSARGMQGGDEYRLRNRVFDGVFVDVGAHVGAVAAAVLLDHPVTAILVEPIAENVELLRAMVIANGWEDRVKIIQAAVGTNTVRIGTDKDDRWVANLGYNDGETRKVKKITLRQLVKHAGGYIDALKTDCEGGEWGMFEGGGLEKVGSVFGEWHGHNQDFSGPQRLHQALDATHEITRITDMGGVGLFWAVPR